MENFVRPFIYLAVYSWIEIRNIFLIPALGGLHNDIIIKEVYILPVTVTEIFLLFYRH